MRVVNQCRIDLGEKPKWPKGRKRTTVVVRHGLRKALEQEKEGVLRASADQDTRRTS
jgi:hypothetical protein